MSDFHDFWRRFRRNTLAMLGLIVVIGLVLTALASLVVAPYDKVVAQDFPSTLQPPSLAHPMGTDQLGRDVLLRVLYASRTSLLVGFTVVLIGMTVGTSLGLLAGYLGGWVDSVISRFSDVMLAFPFLLMAIAVTAALGPSLWNLIIALGVATFPSYTRLVRGSVLAIKAEQFVDAAQSIGVGKVRIMLRHILPNLMGTLLVYGTLRVSTAILAESGLSFLGLGAQPPEPTWGNMLSDARESGPGHPGDGAGFQPAGGWTARHPGPAAQGRLEIMSYEL
jgi:ABC-type dipeptide/oligopeptide/nickel transport system permease subunit